MKDTLPAIVKQAFEDGTLAGMGALYKLAENGIDPKSTNAAAFIVDSIYKEYPQYKR